VEYGYCVLNDVQIAAFVFFAPRLTLFRDFFTGVFQAAFLALVIFFAVFI
jgi:hypothetical protein